MEPPPHSAGEEHRDQPELRGKESPRTTLLLGAIFPATAGLALYGWRAALTLALLLLSAALATRLWQTIGRRGGWLHLSHVLWLTALLGLMLPPHLLANSPPGLALRGSMLWLILPAAAGLLVMLVWLMGQSGPWRMHPLLLTYLVLVLLLGAWLAPRLVLHRSYVFIGDLSQYAPMPEHALRSQAWFYLRDKPSEDAIFHESSAAERLTDYTRRRAFPPSAARLGGGIFISVDSFLRDAMPPLEDLVVAGHPGPIGASSAIAVLVGGLFLLYRGVMPLRVPVITILAAYVGLLLLPVPAVVDDAGTQWRSLALPGTRLDPATVLTFANYQVFASPLLFMAFFLAAGAGPRHPRAIVLWGIVLGLLAAACQLYISCSIGPYIALAAAALLTPSLDRPLQAPLDSPGCSRQSEA